MATLFASPDPIAIDSVAYAFLRYEYDDYTRHRRNG